MSQKNQREKFKNILAYLSDEENALANAPLEEINSDLRKSGIEPCALLDRLKREKAALGYQNRDKFSLHATTCALKETLDDWLRGFSPIVALAVSVVLVVGLIYINKPADTLSYRNGLSSSKLFDEIQKLNGQLLLLDERKEFSKAVTVAMKTVLLLRQYAGPNHPDTAVALNNLALMYKKTGRLAEAVKTYEQAISIEKATLGLNHNETLSSMKNLAILYEQIGDGARAAQLRKQIEETYSE